MYGEEVCSGVIILQVVFLRLLVLLERRCNLASFSPLRIRPVAFLWYILISQGSATLLRSDFPPALSSSVRLVAGATI